MELHAFPFLEMGLLMLVALVGIYLANRLRQSMVIGYLVAGILMGPNLHLSFAGFGYAGLIRDETLIRGLLEIGLVFLFFYVGLEFSFARLRETEKAATVIAVTHIALNMFLGFVLGALLHWSLLETIFLAGVVTISSIAVSQKTLSDMKRNKEKWVEYWLGMNIVEDFILIILLAVAGGWAARGSLSTWDAVRLGGGVIVVFLLFQALGLFVIPRIRSRLEHMQNDESIVICMLMVVLLAAALAQWMGVPPAIGAFFVGMSFAGSGISEQFLKRTDAIRNGFTAIFFLSFGMLISLRLDVVYVVLQLLAITVPLVILNDLFLTGAMSYLIGFDRRDSLNLGASMCSRGEDSLLYASVGEKAGLKASSANFGPVLLSFAGVYCFVLSAITPFLIKGTRALADDLARRMPVVLATGGRLIQRSIAGLIQLPVPAGQSGVRPFLALLAVYAVLFFATLVTAAELPRSGLYYMLLLVVTMATFVPVWLELERTVRPGARLAPDEEFGLIARDPAAIHGLVFHTVGAFLFLPVAILGLWPLLGGWSAVAALAILGAIVSEMTQTYRLMVPLRRSRLPPERLVPSPVLREISLSALGDRFGAGSKSMAAPGRSRTPRVKERPSGFRSLPVSVLLSNAAARKNSRRGRDA